jgi:hypothetical protein
MIPDFYNREKRIYNMTVEFTSQTKNFSVRSHWVNSGIISPETGKFLEIKHRNLHAGSPAPERLRVTYPQAKSYARDLSEQGQGDVRLATPAEGAALYNFISTRFNTNLQIRSMEADPLSLVWLDAGITDGCTDVQDFASGFQFPRAIFGRAGALYVRDQPELF